MHEAGIVQRRRRLEAGDVPAEFGRGLVRAQHDRGGVPPDQRADLVLDRAVAWMRRLVIGRDGVDIGGVGGKRQLGALAPGRLNDPVQQLVDPADAFEGLDGIQRIEPFTCFCGIAILVQCLLLFGRAFFYGTETEMMVVPQGNQSSFSQPQRRTLFPA